MGLAEVGGWVVAALIAVVAVLIQYVRSARKVAAEQTGPPPESQEAAAVRATVVEVAQEDIDALLAGLEGTDSSGFIADAANAARDKR